MRDFVGLDSLEPAPALLSGMRSILDAPSLAAARHALFNFRQLSLSFVTTHSVRHAVTVYNDHHHRSGSSGPYRIDAQSLRFERSDAFDSAEIIEARRTLSSALPHQPQTLRIADPAAPMAVQISDDALAVRVPLQAITAPLPPRRTHALERRPGGPVSIPLADLRQLAAEMDALDASAPERRPGSWRERLERFGVMMPAHQRLEEGQEILLQGTRHLIGLPGSGKTTLLMLMAAWLARQGKRTMLLFPSIGVARQYMADLTFYGVRVGMLVGQSPQTRRRHADHVADAIAADGGNGGFAHTLPGADTFALNCPLPAFSNGDVSLWPFGHAPCEAILQGGENDGRMSHRLCPLWMTCGRHKASRDLLDADVWVGHVLSMDTGLPAHASVQRLRYFELIARTFDVVVFDEADLVQANLDAYGTAVLNISGSEGSIHQTIQGQVLRRLAGNENHRLFDRATEIYTRDLSEFGSHNHALVHTVQRIHPRVSNRFANRLLTTGRIIAELLGGLGDRPPARDVKPDDEVSAGFSRSRALADLWDWAAYGAFYDRNASEPPQWPKLELCARVLGVPVKRLRSVHQKLTGHFRRYLAETLADRQDRILQDITDLYLATCFAGSPLPPGAHDAVQLLVAVTFMILGYQRIVPGTRTMVSEGLLREPPVEATASQDLRRFVPENILGKLSGVRYTFNDARTTRSGARNVELGYVSFEGAPRMLMHRFHTLLGPEGATAGPAVLLTSATSFLEASPAYHVACGPHYLLQPRTPEHDGSASTYRFKWIPDTERGDLPLRYSGAGDPDLARRNLEKMVDALLWGGEARSEIYKSIRRFDVREGIGRKAALVVNGYDQARQIKRFIDDHHREIHRRVKVVVDALSGGEPPSEYLTRDQVEAVGDDEHCDILIFPMLAIGRGVNVVFTSGPRQREAAIGSIYFLTRPHPPADDLRLLTGLAGRATQRFDAARFDPTMDAARLAAAWRKAKGDMFRLARRLLEEPLMASRLGAELFKPFTADQMVAILQTIGRGMRGGCPVAVYFVDAAWAPNSARGQPDGPRDSMLVQMRLILEECVASPDPILRQVYRELYGPFLDPLRRVEQVIYPGALNQVEDRLYADDGLDDSAPLMEN